MSKDHRTIIRGELALLLVVWINSLGVVLMLHSGSGIQRPRFEGVTDTRRTGRSIWRPVRKIAVAKKKRTRYNTHKE